MKALAAEMVRNFGKRLEPLGLAVKELTGDMQLTKNEIMRTQVRKERMCYYLILLLITDNNQITICNYKTGSRM